MSSIERNYFGQVCVRGGVCRSGMRGFLRFAQEFAQGDRYRDFEHQSEYQESQREDPCGDAQFREGWAVRVPFPQSIGEPPGFAGIGPWQVEEGNRPSEKEGGGTSSRSSTGF
jgi:hypothetical protein